MDSVRDVGTEILETGRRGALAHVPDALHFLGLRELAVGSLAAADACFSDQAEMELARGQVNTGDTGRVVVLAWRGDERETRALAEEVALRADEGGVGWAAVRVDAAIALLELGRGNYGA